MSYVIKHRLAIYLDTNSKDFYFKGSVMRQLRNLDRDLKIPYVYKEIPFKDPTQVDIRELAPLDHDLNIVLLPNRLHVVHLSLQAQKIILQIGFGKKEKGSYCTFTQRVRRYLKGEPLDARWKTLFSYGTPYTKLIDICMMMDIVDIKMFQILRKQVKKLHIAVKDRQTALQVISLKEMLLKRHASLEELQARNHSINFYGRQYEPIPIRMDDNDSDMSKLQK